MPIFLCIIIMSIRVPFFSIILIAYATATIARFVAFVVLVF